MSLSTQQERIAAMSEFLGQIMGSLSGLMGAAGGMGGLLVQLLGTAEGATGGELPVMLAQLENAGFGRQVQSWTSGDEKLPVTADQVVAAIPAEQLAAMAVKLNVTPDVLAGHLAEVLPHVTEHVSRGKDNPPERDDL